MKSPLMEYNKVYWKHRDSKFNWFHSSFELLDNCWIRLQDKNDFNYAFNLAYEWDDKYPKLVLKGFGDYLSEFLRNGER